MNENLNLVEILKDAPKGTKLWSPICGECEFSQIIEDEEDELSIECKTKADCEMCYFSAKGHYSTYAESECVLFPSKENRDWSTFTVSNKHNHFEPFQKVLVKYWINSRSCEWVSALYGHYDAYKNIHFLSNFAWVEDNRIIPFEGNEDKLGKIAEK